MLRRLYAPVDWWSRAQVLIGTLCMVFVTNYWVLVLYIALWGGVVYQAALSSAYYKGWNDFLVDTGLPTSPKEAEEFIEFVEMKMNMKVVALEDLRDICIKYNIPLEEMNPIVQRGF